MAERNSEAVLNESSVAFESQSIAEEQRWHSGAVCLSADIDSSRRSGEFCLAVPSASRRGGIDLLKLRRAGADRVCLD